jgi:hypothetical protein
MWGFGARVLLSDLLVTGMLCSVLFCFSAGVGDASSLGVSPTTSPRKRVAVKIAFCKLYSYEIFCHYVA